MKQYGFMCTFVITLILPFSSHANTFCVSDATGLQTVLTIASGNGEDDTIQIVQGNYVGNFIYVSTEANSLTIEGGYTSGCSSRDVDPANTVLDANEVGNVLIFSTPNTEADMGLGGLTLQNGVARNGKGGGIYTNTDGNITISNSIIAHNDADLGAAGVHVEYSESITFSNNIITSNLTSGGVAANSAGSITFTNNTIMDNSWSGICANSAGSITFTNNTITGNTAYSGGGVNVESGSNITFTNNTIENNTAQYAGGVYAISNSVTFTDNNITGNSADESAGGVYAGSDSSVTFTNNNITGNSAYGDVYITGGGGGGGIKAKSVSITFTDNTIKGNSTGSGGGGIYIGYSNNINFVNNSIADNTARNGGGILVFRCNSSTFINNTIENNIAQNCGGAFVSSGNSSIFINNIITANTAESDSGGGVSTSSSFTTLINNTITGNSAGDYGGGGLNIYLTNNDDVADIINNIIWNNTATGSGNDIYIKNDINVDYFPSTVTLYNNDFDQSAAGTYIQLPFTIDASNLDNEDPLFADAVNNNCHLTVLSPCINTGRLEGAPSDDIDGDSRPQGAGVDIGADEFDPSAPPTTTTVLITTTTSALTTTTTTTPLTSTTTTASSQPCTSESIYGEGSEETELLRYFRDNVLSQTPEGQEMIKLYYQWSPIIVKVMEQDEEFKKEIKEMIDGVLLLISK